MTVEAISAENRNRSLVGRVSDLAPTYAYTAAASLFGVLGGVVLARTLGPKMRGEFAAVIVWPTVLSVGMDLGIGYAVSYRVSKAPQLASILWSQTLAFGLSIGGLVAIAASLILRTHLQTPDIDISLYALAMSAIPLMMMATNQGYLFLGLGSLRSANLIRVISPAIYGGGIALCAGLHLGSIRIYMAVYFIAQLTAFITANVLAVRRFELRINRSISAIGETVRFGIKAQIGALCTQATLRLDQLAMSVLVPPKDLGMYVVAVALSSAIIPFFTATTLVLSKAMLTARSDSDAGTRLITTLSWSGALAIPPVVLAVVFAPSMVKAIFGENFSGAIGATRILFPAALFQGMNVQLSSALRNFGRPGLNAVAETIGVGSTVVLLWQLLPRYGIIGAAVTSLCAYGLLFAVQLTFAIRLIRSHQNAMQMVHPASVAVP